MFGRRRGGTATIDGKNEAIAQAIDEMASKLNVLKRDAREDLCEKGKLAFDGAIQATKNVAKAVRGELGSRPVVDPNLSSLRDNPTPTQLERGRGKVAGWIDQVKDEITQALRNTPPARLEETIVNKIIELRTKVRRMTMNDLR